ncbi:hypothetical protein GV794_24430 [Nocardia cyriacigeorgica]|uniref:Uncharacterized protein n=1 Tax=Nocardia cyriacigeorgica TaxID=135487 RepID=A0A6P1D7V6_9NOCA|nr:hypothetical protein [Nocardia cyriacigeorgica]NEW46168.1 hypothetical protein [Nocardia cyriacigeorgica]NEW50592.1 hypothetical protein [Nocardia cyriacigeorgica]NEW58760.1 hypothetical protein [Nocardia cyriacigeorgica]
MSAFTAGFTEPPARGLDMNGPDSRENALLGHRFLQGRQPSSDGSVARKMCSAALEYPDPS